MVQRLSPRRWVFAWRIDERRVVMAMAHFLDGRIELEPTDSAMVRLVCDAGIHAGSGQGSAAAAATSDLASEPVGLVWPKVERRRQVVPKWMSWPALALCVGSALLAAWLAVVSVPQARTEVQARQADIERLQSMADGTVTRSVASALATGDYGEVQTALSGFAQLGYFDHAVVLNASARVVAQVGQVPGARIGDALGPEALGQAQSVDLVLGSESSGKLLILRPPARLEHSLALPTMQLLAGAALAASALAAGLIAARKPERRRRRSGRR